MKKILVLFLAMCLLLSGCSSWMSGSYSSVQPHTEPSNYEEKPNIPVYNYGDLTAALRTLIESGADSGILSVQYGTEAEARTDFETAVREVQQNDPFAAYAVGNIGYAFGASGSRNAVSVRISYLPNRVRTDKIQRVQSLDEVKKIVAQRLDDCSAGVVLYFEALEQMDYAQFVEDYALANPQKVMEIPEVTVSLYPEEGEKQILELKFGYETSRVELRALQNKVAPVFSSALQYVTGNWNVPEKILRLYTFLMDRYEYKIQTSITPAYSLLLYGVGDSRAFAMVYAAMCTQAGIDCRVVTGTRDGATWVWNAVKIDGTYYYLDLLRSNQEGIFTLYEQDQMSSYVWDYSAFSVEKENS